MEYILATNRFHMAGLAELILILFIVVIVLGFCRQKALIFIDLYDILLRKEVQQTHKSSLLIQGVRFQKNKKEMSLKSTSRLRRILLKVIK